MAKLPVSFYFPSLSREQKNSLMSHLQKKTQRLARLFRERQVFARLVVKVKMLKRRMYELTLHLQVPGPDIIITRISNSLLDAFELAYNDCKEALLERLSEGKKEFRAHRRAWAKLMIAERNSRSSLKLALSGH